MVISFISIPPNVLLVLITTSDSIIAFLKSHLTPPNTAIKSAPVNFSPSNFTSFLHYNISPLIYFSFFLCNYISYYYKQ